MLLQEQYTSNLQELPLNCSFADFRGRRHDIFWLTHTRPDLCAAVGLLSQVAEARFDHNAINLANNTIRKAKLHSKRGLRQHDLDVNSLRIIAFSDLSFANNHDYGTQLGNAIILTDNTGRANWMSFSSYKCQRVVRTVLGGETYAFADCFDMTFMIRYDMERATNVKIPLTILTDSESLFKVIVKSSTTTEKRFMINIQAAREAFETYEIDNVGWIRTKDNIADGLTKTKSAPLSRNYWILG